MSWLGKRSADPRVDWGSCVVDDLQQVTAGKDRALAHYLGSPRKKDLMLKTITLGEQLEVLRPDWI